MTIITLCLRFWLPVEVEEEEEEEEEGEDLDLRESKPEVPTSNSFGDRTKEGPVPPGEQNPLISIDPVPLSIDPVPVLRDPVPVSRDPVPVPFTPQQTVSKVSIMGNHSLPMQNYVLKDTFGARPIYAVSP